MTDLEFSQLQHQFEKELQANLAAIDLELDGEGSSDDGEHGDGFEDNHEDSSLLRL